MVQAQPKPNPKPSLKDQLEKIRAATNGRRTVIPQTSAANQRPYRPTTQFTAVDPADDQRARENERQRLAEQKTRDAEAFKSGVDAQPVTDVADWQYIEGITRQIWEFITTYSDQHHYPPTIREVSEACYISTTSVDRHIEALEKAGVVTRATGKARGIQLIMRTPQADAPADVPKRTESDRITPPIEATGNPAADAHARMIEDTLETFKAPGKVVDIRRGATITQYCVEPGYLPTPKGKKRQRVKVSAIAALDKDLQLALGAKSIRIESPVPGKPYVGIEVPNATAETVHLNDVLESDAYAAIGAPLTIALGKMIDGTPIAVDLATMPHLLIAGTTGAGKSVCVNAIVASLLRNNAAERLQFVMIDPKRVELTQYNGIPHLLAPVATDPGESVNLLIRVMDEMDRRYSVFEAARVRNIGAYNQRHADNPLPYIVVIIDELADLMLHSPDAMENTMQRLAALARATGIHLVVATQRPSGDVITGVIKANFPTRIALSVASNTDSRVILDQAGAERLLGRGDMLYMSKATPAPIRLQGVYLSDDEIDAMIEALGGGQVVEETSGIARDFVEKTVRNTNEHIMPIRFRAMGDSPEYARGQTVEEIDDNIMNYSPPRRHAHRYPLRARRARPQSASETPAVERTRRPLPGVIAARVMPHIQAAVNEAIEFMERHGGHYEGEELVKLKAWVISQLPHVLSE